MLADVTFALAAPIAGFFTALCLLHFWVGGVSTSEAENDEPVLLPEERPDDPDGPFIPMPAHLKTREEMVAWMTTDLPRMARELPRPRP